MKVFKSINMLGLYVVSLVLPFSLSAAVFTSTNQTTGDSVTVWDTFTPLGFDILVSLQSLGSWTPSLNIGDPLTSPKNPIASINASGDIAAVWIGYDPILFTNTITAATYTAGVWSSLVTLSNPALEHVMDGYQVKIADTGSVVVTWTSYMLLTGDTVTRAIYRSPLGVWGSPVTL